MGEICLYWRIVLVENVMNEYENVRLVYDFGSLFTVIAKKVFVEHKVAFDFVY